MVDHWHSVLPVVVDPEITTGPSSQTNVTDREDSGSNHAIAVDGQGNYMIVWSQHNGLLSDWDVWAQTFNASGQSTGIFRVNETTLGDQQHASVAADSAGNYVVTWTDNQLLSSQVAARVFYANGTDSGEFVVADNGSDNGDSSVAISDNGRFVVVWEYQNDVFASLYQTSGAIALNTDVAVNSGGRDATDPDVSMDSVGNFVVVWDAEHEIRSRRFDSAGNDTGGQKEPLKEGGGVEFDDPAVALRNDGSFIVVATRDDAGALSVLGGIVDIDDHTSNFAVSQTASGTQRDPSVSGNDDGSFVVTWSGNGSQAGQVDSSGVFYRFFSATAVGGSGNASTATPTAPSSIRRWPRGTAIRGSSCGVARPRTSQLDWVPGSIPPFQRPGLAARFITTLTETAKSPMTRPSCPASMFGCTRTSTTTANWMQVMPRSSSP
jgi:hypothetical protein